MGIFSNMFGRGADSKSGGPRKGSFGEALAMHLRGEVEPALAAYQQIALQVPDDYLASFFAAAIKAGKGEVAEAADTLRTISRRAADSGMNITKDLSLNLGALIDADTSVAEVAEIIVTFGDTLKKEGLLRESAVCFECASGIVPDNAGVLHKLGDTLHDLRMYDYAESVLRYAIKCAPNHWGALYTLAVLLQDLGRNGEALIYYDRALRLNPEHAKCQNNYGAALLATGQFPEAQEHCSIAVKLDPASPLARINLGNANLMLQEYKAARSCFQKALELGGEMAPAYYGLGAAEQALGTDAGKVRELYLKAIELNPLADFHRALANLLAAEGDAEALTHFEAAAQANAGLRNLQREYGIACLHFKRRDEGLEHLRLALSQNPEDTVAREILTAEGEGQA